MQNISEDIRNAYAPPRSELASPLRRRTWMLVALLIVMAMNIGVDHLGHVFRLYELFEQGPVAVFEYMQDIWPAVLCALLLLGTARNLWRGEDWGAVPTSIAAATLYVLQILVMPPHHQTDSFGLIPASAVLGLLLYFEDRREKPVDSPDG